MLRGHCKMFPVIPRRCLPHRALLRTYRPNAAGPKPLKHCNEVIRKSHLVSRYYISILSRSDHSLKLTKKLKFLIKNFNRVQFRFFTLYLAGIFLKLCQINFQSSIGSSRYFQVRVILKC